MSCLLQIEAISQLMLPKAFGQSPSSLDLLIPEEKEKSGLWY